MKTHNVEQGSLDWLKLHIGIPTAGGLDNLLTPEFELRKGETPKTYIYKNVAASWRGKVMIDPNASSYMMEQGLILESEAIPFYELTTGRKITRVGFITTDDGRFGCSPDGMIFSGDDTATKNRERSVSHDERLTPTSPRVDCGIEIKCPSPHVHVKYLTEGVVPKEYRAQVQGGMFATGFSKWVFVSYCRGFPPLILEVMRDEKQQSAIADAIDLFHKGIGIAKSQIERIQSNPLNDFK